METAGTASIYLVNEQYEQVYRELVNDLDAAVDCARTLQVKVAAL